MAIRKCICLILIINLSSCSTHEKKEMKKESFEIINQYLVPIDLEGVRRWLFLDHFTNIGRINSIKKNYKNDEFLILTCANIKDSVTLEMAYDILTVDTKYNVNEEEYHYNNYGIKKDNVKATLIQVDKMYILENYSDSYEQQFFEFHAKLKSGEEYKLFKERIRVLKADPKKIFFFGVGNKNEIPQINSYQLLPK